MRTFLRCNNFTSIRAHLLKERKGILNQKVVYNFTYLPTYPAALASPRLLEAKKCIKTLQKLQSRKFFRSLRNECKKFQLHNSRFYTFFKKKVWKKQQLK